RGHRRRRDHRDGCIRPQHADARGSAPRFGGGVSPRARDAGRSRTGYRLAAVSTSVVPERALGIELVAVTEAAAISAAHWMGHGDRRRADHAAVEAMRGAMDDVSFRGRIVIGEGERDEAPMLYIGEQVGSGELD